MYRDKSWFGLYAIKGLKGLKGIYSQEEGTYMTFTLLNILNFMKNNCFRIVLLSITIFGMPKFQKCFPNYNWLFNLIEFIISIILL